MAVALDMCHQTLGRWAFVTLIFYYTGYISLRSGIVMPYTIFVDYSIFLVWIQLCPVNSTKCLNIKIYVVSLHERRIYKCNAHVIWKWSLWHANKSQIFSTKLQTRCKKPTIMIQETQQKERKTFCFLSFNKLTYKKPNATRNNTFLLWKSLLKNIFPFHCLKMEILNQPHVSTVLEI